VREDRARGEPGSRTPSYRPAHGLCPQTGTPLVLGTDKVGVHRPRQKRQTWRHCQYMREMRDWQRWL